MSITTLKPTVTKKSETQEQFFKEHIAKQKDSGLSRLAYCRNHLLNYDHFNYWFRKDKKEVQQLVPIKLSQPVEPTPFKSINATGVLCTLTFKSGGVLQVHDKSILPLIFSTLN